MSNCNPAIVPFSATQRRPTSLTIKVLYDHLLKTLRNWHEPSASQESPLSQLRIIRHAQQANGGSLHTNILHVLNDAVANLAQTNARYAEVIRRRFQNNETAEAVGNSIGFSSSAFSRLQKDAITALADLLLHEETALRIESRATYEMRLDPPSYSQLFGIEEPLAQLLDVAAPVGPPWLVTVEGMGGMGKTSLAHAALRAAIQQDLFDDFGWISARQYRFQPIGMIETLDKPALTLEQLVENLCTQLLGEAALPKPFSVERTMPVLLDYLKAVPSLIVVDNLETLVDVNELLPTLQRLSNPSKFILTSRENIHGEIPTFPFRIPSLAQEAALALVRHEANERNQVDLANATDQQLQPIFEMVGGNPLALRLVVGQTGFHELSAVLAALRDARGQAVDNLYTFIYRYAWDNLDEQSQRILLVMPLVSEIGETGDFIEGIVDGIPREQVRDALQMLVSLNLVNRQGDFTRSLYTIHNLTRTFLLKQVAKWV